MIEIDTTPAPQADAPSPLHLKAVPGDKPLTRRQHRLIEDALAIEDAEAESPHATGYLARTLAQATLPHRDPKLPPGMLFARNTGLLTMTISPTNPKYGIPFGSIPRVILAWICTEAKSTNSRQLSLGRSQAHFMRKIGLHSNGRDIARCREQASRLFGAVISVAYTDTKRHRETSTRLLISDSSNVFWHPNPGVAKFWDSSLILSENFFQEIMAAPVPIKLPVLHSLSKSPLAMDIYTWLTYRIFLLLRSKRPSVFIPWAGLQTQLGTGYPNTYQGLQDFKKNFRLRLKEVFIFYPEAQPHVAETPIGIILTPCKQHIANKQ